MGRIFLAVLLLCWSALLAADYCSVRLNVVNVYGVPQSYSLQHFVSESKERDYADQFKAGTAKAIPCGLYQYDVVSRLGIHATGRAFVLNPQVWENIPIGELGDQAPGHVIKGQVRGARSGSGPYYVAFVQAFGEYRFHAGIDKEGVFTLYDPPPGVFLVEVIEGSNIRHTEIIRIPLEKESLVIDLGKDEKRTLK